METEKKAGIRHSWIFRVLIFVCVILVAVTHQAEMNNNEIMKMLVKLDQEQHTMRSEIDEIKKSSSKGNLEYLDTENFRASLTKRDGYSNAHIHKTLVTILRELNSLKSRASTFNFF